MGLLKKVIVIFAVILISGLAFKNTILKHIITSVATAQLGTDVTLDSVSLQILKGELTLRELTIAQPKGFGNNLLAHIPEISMQINIAQMLKQKTSLNKASLSIKEVNLIRNTQGQLNATELNVLKKSDQNTSTDSPKETLKTSPQKPKKTTHFYIKDLSLNIGKATYLDQSSNKKRTFNINFNKEFHDVSSVKQLTHVILFEVIKSANIAHLLQDSLSSVLDLSKTPLKALNHKHFKKGLSTLKAGLSLFGKPSKKDK